MYDYYFFKILMREREGEILKAFERGGHQGHRRRVNPGLSKKIASRFLSTFSRLKKFLDQRQGSKPATGLKCRSGS